MAAPNYNQLDVCSITLLLGKSGYSRPCIIIENLHNGKYEVVPLSTKNYSKFKSDVFQIFKDDPNFSETGLEDSCFALGMEVQIVNESSMGAVKGKLTGDLARRFLAWIN